MRNQNDNDYHGATDIQLWHFLNSTFSKNCASWCGKNIYNFQSEIALISYRIIIFNIMSYLFMKAIYMKPVVGKIYSQYHLYG